MSRSSDPQSSEFLSMIEALCYAHTDLLCFAGSLGISVAKNWNALCEKK